jgi:CheY-like chemotaxis protein
MTARHRVALQGFSAFERNALASCFRLTLGATPGYEAVDAMDQAEFVIADADHSGIVDAVTRAGRVGDTIFVGAAAPEGAAAWTMRPIDPLYVLRELDAMAALRHPAPAPAPSRRATPREAPGRRAADVPDVPASPVTGDAEVLLVDDSDVALRMLERELAALGLRTHSVHTSAEAFDRLAAHRVDAVILDVDLGDASELDGLSMCQRLKRAHRELGTRAPAVVLLTVHDEPVNRVRGALAGCDAYLSKPVDVPLLARTLRELGVPVSDATPPEAPLPG